MAKVIGIDLGTTNCCVAVMEGGEPVVIPNAEGGAHHAVGRRGHEDRRAARRPGGQAPGRHQPGEHRSSRSSASWAASSTTREVQRDLSLRAVQGRRPANGDAACQDRRPRLQPAGGLGDDPAEAEGGRRGLPGRDRHRGRHHGPGLLQRHASARRPRTPARSPASKCCASSTSRPRPRSPTASTRRTTRSSPSTTSAAAPSTSRSSSSARASSRCARTNGDTHLGGDDFDQRDHRLAGRRVQEGPGHRPAQDRMALQRLKEAAEKAKIELSTDAADRDQPAVHHGRRQRPEAPQRHADPRQAGAAGRRPRRAHPRAGAAGARGRRQVKPSEIDEVVLVGGQTRMPPVAEGASQTSSARSRTRASTRTRSSPSAPRSRPACSGARSRTSCSST